MVSLSMINSFFALFLFKKIQKIEKIQKIKILRVIRMVGLRRVQIVGSVHCWLLRAEISAIESVGRVLRLC